MNLITQPKGVIFDCDGTLVLTEHIYTKAYQIILASHGVYLSEEAIKTRYSGQSLFSAIKKIEEEFGITDPDFVRKFDSICTQLKKQGLIETTGTRQTIEKLIQEKIKYAIASNAPQDVIGENIKILPEINLPKDLIISACDHQRFKPDPFIFELAAYNLGLDMSRTIIIEDSSSGVEAALQTNSTPIIILNGNNDHMAQRYPNVIQITDMREILNYL